MGLLGGIRTDDDERSYGRACCHIPDGMCLIAHDDDAFCENPKG
jgi:hypothetical protein